MNSRPLRLATTLIIGALIGGVTVSSCGGPEFQDSDALSSITLTDFSAGSERMAWETWDFQGGARLLKVDPSRPFKVEFVGDSRDYPQNMEEYDLALIGKDAHYYVFRAVYND